MQEAIDFFDIYGFDTFDICFETMEYIDMDIPIAMTGTWGAHQYFKFLQGRIVMIRDCNFTL